MMTSRVLTLLAPRGRFSRALLLLSALLVLGMPAAVAWAGVAHPQPPTPAAALAPASSALRLGSTGPTNGCPGPTGTAACPPPNAPTTPTSPGAPPVPLQPGTGCTPDTPICPATPPLPLAPTQPDAGCIPEIPATCAHDFVPPPPVTPTAPCTAWDCIPQPPPTIDRPVPAPPPPPPPPSDTTTPSGPLSWLENFLFGWLNHLVAGIVFVTLGPLLNLLGNTILATPAMDHIPVVLALWGNSAHIAITFYVLLIMAAGILVMAYQTVQTRTSIKEAAPRVVMGFFATILSLFVGGKAIELANDLTKLVLAGVNLNDVANYFTESLADRLDASNQGGSPQGFLFFLFTALALIIMIVVVIITYFIRVMITAILLIAAPLLLMFHALPHTEAIAAWWWRAFGTVMAIQIAQSLVLAAAIRAFYFPGPLFTS